MVTLPLADTTPFQRELTLALARLTEQEAKLLQVGVVLSQAKASGLHALAKICDTKIKRLAGEVNTTRGIVADLQQLLSDPSPTSQTDIESAAPPAPLKRR